MHQDEWLNDYIMQHQPEDQIGVYLGFHGDNKLKRGKDWSHFGALQWKMPRDQTHYVEEIKAKRGAAEHTQKAAVRNMGSYRQSPAHAGNKEARRALRDQLKEAAELVEQRDYEGYDSLNPRQQNLLHDYETNKLHRKLEELSQGCEPIPPFFRI